MTADCVAFLTCVGRVLEHEQIIAHDLGRAGRDKERSLAVDACVGSGAVNSFLFYLHIKGATEWRQEYIKEFIQEQYEWVEQELRGLKWEDVFGRDMFEEARQKYREYYKVQEIYK